MRRVVVLVLLLAACGSGQSEPPPDPDTPLLQVQWVGGFAPAEFALTQGPAYTLTRDGILISPAAIPAIFPGPLVTPYMASDVTPGEIRQLEDLIERIGLPDMVSERDDEWAGQVADANTTVVTYWDGDGAHTYAVYALGIFEPTRAATRSTQELITVLETLAGRAANNWQGDKVQIVASPGTVDPGFADEQPWPLDETVDTWTEVAGSRCKVFDASVLDLFLNANQATTFPSPDPEWAEVVRLAVRPLHPGENGCSVPLS